MPKSDIAGDRDNKNWNPFILSAQTYTGYIYDYYLTNFGRKGLDDRNIRVRFIVNPVNPETQSALESQYPAFFNNAGYRGNAIVVFGVGTGAQSCCRAGHRRSRVDARCDGIHVQPHLSERIGRAQ